MEWFNQEISVLVTLLHLLEHPLWDIADIGRNGQPTIRLLPKRTPSIECCTHLLRIKGKRVLTDVDAVGNRNRPEVVAQQLGPDRLIAVSID